jgi:hypothetical protein
MTVLNRFCQILGDKVISEISLVQIGAWMCMDFGKLEGGRQISRKYCN